MTEPLEAAAKRLFLHNVREFDVDDDAADYEWVTDPELREFWVSQIRAAFEANA